MITITIDGGLVQSVSTDTESEKQIKIVVVDYDVGDGEGALAVPQGDGEIVDAFVDDIDVGDTHPDIAKFLLT